MASQLQMEGAPDHKIVLVNAQRLDFDQRLNFTKLALRGVVERHYEDAPTDDQIVAFAEGATVLVTKEIGVSAELIARLPASIRLICEAGTGYNNVDLAAAQERGIIVTNVPEYSSTAVAQLVLTFVLDFSASMMQQQRMLATGNHSHFGPANIQLPMVELQGKTIGLVGGKGKIGTQVARLCMALGMHVIVSTRSIGDEPAVETLRPLGEFGPEVRRELTESLEDLLRRSDFVSLHCPLTPATRHLMGASEFSAMKDSALLINTARGAIVDQAALIAALGAEGQPSQIAGAALDVQDPEPPADDSPLYTLPNVQLTPHIGWKRFETRQRLIDAVAVNVAAFQDGDVKNVVTTS